MISVVLNKLGFWIWHGCMCKGYAEFQICLIMAPNVSIILREYASISLNARQYAWQWLKKLFWPMPGLSICRNIVIINIIIIVTNVVILEFLSAWFAHHALLFFFSFLTWLEHKNNESYNHGQNIWEKLLFSCKIAQ